MNITITVKMEPEPGDPKEITLKAALKTLKKSLLRVLKMDFRELAKRTIEQSGSTPAPSKPRHKSKPARKEAS